MEYYNDFRRQIKEDILEYQSNYPNIKNIKTDSWAFNFWVLDKLYSEDENLIENLIVDYNDKGIDCYVWHEELKNLYLIQNKYYGDNSTINVDYFFNDFLTRSIGSLEKETYARSDELQKIFTKYKNDKEFRVYMYLYMTNDNIVEGLEDKIKKYNREHEKYFAKIFYLKDIEELYFDEPMIDEKNFTAKIYTINNGTHLNINTEQYGLNVALDARYVMTPVNVLYDLFQSAKKARYPIFDSNIREYLGSKGTVNKKIDATLANPEERKNFFYYNNGITVICKDIKKVNTLSNTNVTGCSAWFEVDNPQIVNGCQTVSTINERLDMYPTEERIEQFKDTFVMVKFLKITSCDNELYENIVRYNNSQNSINEKTFCANQGVFIRLQTEFLNRGFLLKIKQSDKHKFKEKYKNITKLLDLSKDILDKYGLEFTKVDNFIIDLEKLLQVVLAFNSGAQQAVQKKSQLLVANSKQYDSVISFIKNSNVTINNLIDLYLFYVLCEKVKKDKDDSKTPVTFYAIDGISRFQCEGDPTKISDVLKTAGDIEKLVKIYDLATNMYYKEFEGDYNSMIKSEIDYTKFEKQVGIAKDFIR